MQEEKTEIKPLTIDEIKRAAYQGTELPPRLTTPEQMLFLSFRAVYHSFKIDAIETSQAERETVQIMRTYEAAEFDRKIYAETAQMRNRLSMYITEIEKSGCPKCQLAVRIFDGRDKNAKI